MSKKNSLYVAPEEGANALLHPKPPLPQVSITHGVVEQPALPISVQLLEQHVDAFTPVLEIRFGPPTADFWSVWSSQKARKFQQNQPTT